MLGVVVANRSFQYGFGPFGSKSTPLHTVLTTSDGVELRYQRSGAGAPVVLLHTLRTQLEYFEAVLERLEAEPLELIAVDLPGHGHSSAPRTDYSAGYFTDAVVQLLDELDVRGATIVGESIGATIALTLAAQRHGRVSRVIAVNPYDYGRGGGIRRSSPLANILFTGMLAPGLGALIARAETKAILRGVLRGGLCDRTALPDTLVAELRRCGSLPGHARAFCSLTRQWRSWIAARAGYEAIAVPVTLVYSDNDWSRPDERDANARAIPGVRVVTLERCGHFASLEQPDAIARLIAEETRA
jgi:pimeloyl-ACP methyl ester carboxylesterase